jgi:hypothetical protein
VALRDGRLVAGALLLVACGGASPKPVGTQVESPSQKKAEAPIHVARVPLRRLTREEYDNTVRDLLGDVSSPADAFPPDEAVGGFESNNLAPVTSLLVERYMDAAQAVAAHAEGRLDALAPCPGGSEPTECARRFIDRFGRLAFRRPLEEEERATLFGVFVEKAKVADYRAGIRLVLEAILASPQFLYRVEPDGGEGGGPRPLSGYEVATRLSYFLWASTPDEALLDEAARGGLATEEGVGAAARRMLADPKARAGIRSFHRQWLGLRELDTESKDAALGGTFTPELKDAMVEETLSFAVDAALSGGDVVQKLYTSTTTFVNAPLAKLYGVTGPAGAELARVTLPEGQRAGILTQASVLTVLSSGDQTSPILRGKFVREKLLCQPIPPPPVNVGIVAPKVDPKLTTKQRFEQHRRDPSCASCHVMMDPIGFGLEHYDAIGRYRTMDGAFPVDAVGELSMTDDVDGRFDGAIELGARLAGSRQARKCLATQWTRYALGRSERPEDGPSIDAAYGRFAASGFDVRELIVAIAESPSFRFAGSERRDP